MSKSLIWIALSIKKNVKQSRFRFARIIWHYAQKFLLKISNKSHFSRWHVRWNKILGKSLNISSKGKGRKKPEWCIHCQAFCKIVDSYHLQMATNSRMGKTSQTVEPTTRHLRRKELELEEKETIERNKMDAEKIIMICYIKKLCKIIKGIAGLKSLPTTAVRKWAMHISIRPSVGPLIAGRIRVLVKKLDTRKQKSKLSITYKIYKSENMRKIIKRRTSVKKRRCQKVRAK